MHHCVIGNLISWEKKLFPKTLRYKLWEPYLWGPLSQLFEMKMTFLAFTCESTHSQHIISVLSRPVGEIRGMTHMILEILYKCGVRRRTSPSELLNDPWAGWAPYVLRDWRPFQAPGSSKGGGWNSEIWYLETNEWNKNFFKLWDKSSF